MMVLMMVIGDIKVTALLMLTAVHPVHERGELSAFKHKSSHNTSVS